MSQKRPVKVSRIETGGSVVWKVKPPGPEQRELERMFRMNEIEAGESPENVRKYNELFARFTPAVFGNHFRTTKAAYARDGHFARVSGSDAPPLDAIGIPELTGSNQSSGDKGLTPSESNRDGEASLTFSNPPFWLWKYFDHVQNMEFVCVAVVAISGIRDPTLEISEDGYTLCIHYTWPTAIILPTEMFKKAEDKDGTQISMSHPKVHAFVANALDNGVNKFSKPKGEIVVQLPQKVQRIPNSYRIEAMSIDGTNVIMIELSAQHKAAVIDETNKAIVFK